MDSANNREGFVQHTNPAGLALFVVFIGVGIARIVGPHHGTYAWVTFILFWAFCAGIFVDLGRRWWLRRTSDSMSRFKSR